MEKEQIRKCVDDFLNDIREPLEKGLADGTISPFEIHRAVAEIQKEEGLPALGRSIAKKAMGGSGASSGESATDEELEALGADIAKYANGDD